MAIPDFQSFFKPLLEIALDENEHSTKEAREILSKIFNLTANELEERLPSGTQTTFDNRVAWAKSFFVQAKVFESPKRGFFKITPRGFELHKQGHKRIDIRILNQYPEFKAFHTASKSVKKDPIEHNHDQENQSETPEELLQKSYQSIRNELAANLLEKVKLNSPSFFENLVVDLMVSMGYGGTRSDASQSIGKTGDEGIDGIIKEDRLGLDVIYLQAKRWEGTVGRPEVQKFVGALHGQRAKKGVFITTGRYSNDAIDYIKNIDPKVILIDGERLVDFMIDFNLGTTTSTTYEIKKIDSDYFTED
jgi:restriction system protein